MDPFFEVLEPNAAPQLLPEAGAQRTLEAVSSRPLFDAILQKAIEDLAAS